MIPGKQFFRRISETVASARKTTSRQAPIQRLRPKMNDYPGQFFGAPSRDCACLLLVWVQRFQQCLSGPNRRETATPRAPRWRATGLHDSSSASRSTRRACLDPGPRCCWRAWPVFREYKPCRRTHNKPTGQRRPSLRRPCLARQRYRVAARRSKSKCVNCE